MAGIPLRPEDRRPEDPVVLMGGVCAFANPEPIAPVHGLRRRRRGRGDRRGDHRRLPGGVRRRRPSATAGARRSWIASRRSPGSTSPSATRSRTGIDGTIADGAPPGRRARRRHEAAAEEGRRVPDDLAPPDAQRGVRPPGPPRGREGVRARLPVLPGGPDLPPGPAPEPRRAPGDGAGDQEGLDPRRARRGVRVRLSVDRRADEGARGGGTRGLHLLDPRRQPHRGAGLVAAPWRPPDAHGGAGGRHRAPPPRDPQGHLRRAALRRVRPGPRARASRTSSATS